MSNKKKNDLSLADERAALRSYGREVSAAMDAAPALVNAWDGVQSRDYMKAVYPLSGWAGRIASLDEALRDFGDGTSRTRFLRRWQTAERDKYVRLFVRRYERFFGETRAAMAPPAWSRAFYESLAE